MLKQKVKTRFNIYKYNKITLQVADMEYFKFLAFYLHSDL